MNKKILISFSIITLSLTVLFSFGYRANADTLTLQQLQAKHQADIARIKSAAKISNVTNAAAPVVAPIAPAPEVTPIPEVVAPVPEVVPAPEVTPAPEQTVSVKKSVKKINVASLWSKVKDKVGNVSTDTLKASVKEVAQKNNIAIPEWGIAGKLDARNLSASVLNSLNW